MAMMCIIFFLISFGSQVFSIPYLNKKIDDLEFEKYEPFYSHYIPSDTFLSDDHSSISMTVSPNEYVSSSLVDSYAESVIYDVRFIHHTVLDDYMYVVSVFVFVIFDVHELDEPILISVTEIDEVYDSGSVVISGDYAFIGTRNKGILVYDISNKSEVELVTEFQSRDDDISFMCGELFIRDDILFAVGDAYLGVFDISDIPTSPPELLGVDITHPSVVGMREVQVSPDGQYLYSIDRYSFSIYDLRNHTHPKRSGFIDVGFDSYTCAISLQSRSTNYAYVASEHDGQLYIIDISDKENPFIKYTHDLSIPTSGRYKSMSVSGDYAYLSVQGEDDEGNGANIYVIDISDVSEPIIMSEVQVVSQYCYRNLFVYIQGGGKYLIIGCFNGVDDNYGFLTLDATDPNELQEEPVYSLGNEPGSTFFTKIGDPTVQAAFTRNVILIVRDDNDDDEIFFYVAHDLQLLQIFQLYEENLVLQFISEYKSLTDSSYIIRELVIHDHYAYLYVELHTECDLMIVDVSDVYNPVLMVEYKTPQFEAEGQCIYNVIRVLGDRAYILCEFTFYVLDVSEKTNPTVLANFTSDEDEEEFVISKDGNFLYFVGSSSLLNIYDISEEEVFFLVGSCETADKGYLIELNDDESLAYVSTKLEGIQVFDVSDNSNPVLLGNANLVETGKRMILKGEHDLLYISDEMFISIVDVSDPNNPNLYGMEVLAMQNIEEVEDFALLGTDIFFMACDKYGIMVLRFKLSLYGSVNFPMFCGETEVTVIAEDSSGSCEETFVLRKEDYCSGRGECLAEYRCDCEVGYTGYSCETFSCGYDYKDVARACNGRGDCVAPEICNCRSGYTGERCQTNMMYFTIMLPVLTSVGLIGVVAIIFCCVCTCCSCCICFDCVVFSFFAAVLYLFQKFRKQKSGLKKFSKLKNFNLYLKEQEMEEDVSIAHLKINKDLFQIEFDEIEIKELLGEGGSNSVVYKTKWKGQLTAFKCFRTRMILSSQDEFGEFEKEVQIMSSVSHPNILQFLGCSLKPPRVGILMEFCENGDLDQFLKKKKSIQKSEDTFLVHCYPLKEKLRMCFEIISAMSYLHDRKIIHRDMKLENVLVNGMERTKLMDFGLSRLVDRMSQENKTSRIGTSVYMAPEIVLSENYSEKVDVFSFAIMMFIIISENFSPYGDKNSPNIEVVVANNPSLRPNCDELRKMLTQNHQNWIITCIEKCWDHIPQERLSFTSLCEVFEEKMSEFEKEEAENVDVLIERAELKELEMKKQEYGVLVEKEERLKVENEETRRLIQDLNKKTEILKDWIIENE